MSSSSKSTEIHVTSEDVSELRELEADEVMEMREYVMDEFMQKTRVRVVSVTSTMSESCGVVKVGDTTVFFDKQGPMRELKYFLMDIIICSFFNY